MRTMSLFRCVTALSIFSVILLLPSVAAAQAGTDPEPPRVLLDTRYVPPTGAVINVAAGGDFQAALNAARPGDTIILQAGATYTTPPDGFVLPYKQGSGWIVIKSSNMAGLPAEGGRVTPEHAASMARIVTTAVSPAVRTAPGAHHYRFIGIEFTVDPQLPLNYGIVTLGDGSSAQSSLDMVPHDIIIDRCYIHGNATGNISRGVALNSTRTAIIDSHISNCHGVGYDTQAIAGWNGPGPFKIVNNYLEGAGENVLFGGASPAIANLVPSDIEFRRNHCYKPLSWKWDDPSYAGNQWTIKNIFELKNAQRVAIDGNIFENNWVANQDGLAILFTPRGENGQTPWAVVQDIAFTNNIVRHSAGGINITGYDDLGPSRQTQRVSITNNLFDDIGASRWGGNGRLLQILDGTAYVKVDHNTIFHTAQVVITDGRSHTGFVYTNNISRHNSYGVVGPGTSSGSATLERYFPGYVFARNVMTGGPSSLYPPGNFFPPALEDVGFVNLTGGDYRLAAGSPYKGAGTDARDIGADINRLQAAISGDASPPPPPPAGDVVLYASEAQVRYGAWVNVADATAAAGARIFNADGGAPKVGTPYAYPTNYFEMSFSAESGRAYRLWLRGKAQNDSPYNDSVWVQFSDSVTSSGQPVYRIGTSSGADINLEDCFGCGLSGWGWQDNGWGVGVLGPTIYFQTAGTHTIRVQTREDGFSIDQIVLSPATYATASPGALKNDRTILPKSNTSPPPPPPPAPAPTVSAVTPNSGTTSGGTVVGISGTGFVTGAAVSFGGVAATNVTVESGTSITATTPARAAGAVNVTVTNPDNQSGTLEAGFTYASASPPPETVLLADDFDNNSLDTAKWLPDRVFSGFTDSTVAVTEKNQRMEIGALKQTVTGSHYNGIRTTVTHNFSGAYAFVEMVQAPASTTVADAMFTIGIDASNYYRFYVEAGNLVCQKKIAGTKTDLFVVPYDAVNHRFLRIRHDVASGRVMFETAQGAGGTPGAWTQRASQAWDAASVPLSSILFELKAGTWRTESVAPGTVIFDNFRAAKP